MSPEEKQARKELKGLPKPKPGDIITLRSGRKYRVTSKGNLVRVTGVQ